MKYTKTRFVKSPCRGTTRAAGIDFFVPERYSPAGEEIWFIDALVSKNPSLNFDAEGFIVEPHTICFIPSGIKCLIPDGYYLNAGNKSGVATKKGLVYTADTIDEDYEGEIFFALLNYTDITQKIFWGEKIIQLKLQEVSYENVEEVGIEELTELYKKRNFQRGEGCLGSTGVV